MNALLKSISTNAWRTAGARYNAARRLKRRELFSTISLAIFSAFTIFIAFIERIYSMQAGTPLDDYLTAFAVCLGLLLLVTSLVEWGSANGVKADSLHRNAEDLNAFQRKIHQRLMQLNSGESFNWEDIDRLREEYESIKEKCSYNHSPIDDLKFLATHRKSEEFTENNSAHEIGYWASIRIAILWRLSSVWYFSLSWIVILIAIIFAWYIPR